MTWEKQAECRASEKQMQAALGDRLIQVIQISNFLSPCKQTLNEVHNFSQQTFHLSLHTLR